MNLLDCILAKVYRRLQIAYDESRYCNIGALGDNSKICSSCDITPPRMFSLGIIQLLDRDACCGLRMQKL